MGKKTGIVEFKEKDTQYVNLLLFLCGEGKEKYEASLKNSGRGAEFNKMMSPPYFYTPIRHIVKEIKISRDGITKAVTLLHEKKKVIQPQTGIVLPQVSTDWGLIGGKGAFARIVRMVQTEDKLMRLIETDYFKWGFNEYKEQFLEQQITNSGIRKTKVNSKLVYDICLRSPKALNFLISGYPIDVQRMEWLVKKENVIEEVYKIIAQYDFITSWEEYAIDILEVLREWK